MEVTLRHARLGAMGEREGGGSEAPVRPTTGSSPCTPGQTRLRKLQRRLEQGQQHPKEIW